MTKFTKESILNRIYHIYSFSNLSGNFIFVVLLLAFVLSFPEAFDVINYPPLMALIIAGAGMVFFSISYLLIHKTEIESDKGIRKLIAIDKYSSYFRNMLTLVLLPAFGEQYAHLFWFAAVMALSSIFSSAFITLRMKVIAIFSPFYTLVIHYAFWNLPVLFQENRSELAKSFQPVEVGFAILLCFLFYLLFKELGQSIQLAANFSFDDRIIDRYASKHGLTGREKEILIKVLQGKHTKQIGEELYISPGTVRNHLSHIFTKTGTHSRLELASQTYASTDR